MRNFIIKRILISIVILIFVAFIIYVLMRCLPTSYLEEVARAKSMQPGSKSFEEWMQQLSATYGMDKGIIPGFFSWCGKAIRGQFGDSWKWTVPVTQKFHDSVWLSFIMGGIAFVLELLIAIPLGIISAVKQYSKTDYTITIVALTCFSLPTFFFASLLKLVFAVKLKWFDLGGLIGRSYQQLSPAGQFWDKAAHLVLPIITLVVISIGSLMRYTRTNMLEVLNADYIRTARAKGLSQKEIFNRHILKNAIIPIVNGIPGSIILCISGALITESAFAVPGMGKMLPDALRQKNNTMVITLVFIFTTLSIFSVLAGDLLMTVVDPRISLTAKGGE